MKIYLAARYARRQELCGYAEELRRVGHVIDARWLLGEHQLHPGADTVWSADESIPMEARPFAEDDVADIEAADVLISFTESPRSANSSRGGRHVEFGLGFAWGKRLIIIGPRENVFHTLSTVEIYQTWEDFRVNSGLCASPLPQASEVSLARDGGLAHTAVGGVYGHRGEDSPCYQGAGGQPAVHVREDSEGVAARAKAPETARGGVHMTGPFFHYETHDEAWEERTHRQVPAQLAPTCDCRTINGHIVLCALHAAAPDLHKAVQAIIEWANHHLPDCVLCGAVGLDSHHAEDCPVSIAAAAIAKAYHG